MTPLTLVLALGAGPVLATTSGFNGVWVIDVESTTKGSAPEHITLRNGVFSRGEGNSALSVKADGRFHPLAGDTYVDSVSVTVIGPRRVREMDRWKGKLAYEVVYIASSNGDRLTRRVTDFSKPDHKPLVTTMVYHRIGGSPSPHASISGAWGIRSVKRKEASLTERLTLAEGHFRSDWAGGGGYDAVIGGVPVPVRGDAENARAAVTMPNARTVVVRMSLGGVPTVVETMTLLPDDRTISVTVDRLADQNHSGWTMHRQ